MKRVAILGAGIAGLSAAYDLRKNGFAVTVFDKANEVGGRMRTIRQSGFVIDVGAMGLLGSFKETFALVKESGFGEYLHASFPKMGISHGGATHVIDTASPIRSLANLKLLSTSEKLRLLKLVGPLLRAAPKVGFGNLGLAADIDNDNIRHFLRSTVGKDIEENFLSPLVRSMWQADTDALSVVDLFWILKYFATKMFSLDGGMQALPEHLAKFVDVRLETTVRKVQPDDDGVNIEVESSGALVKERFDACLIAAPPRQVLETGIPLKDDHRRYFESVNYSRGVSVHLGLSERPPNSETMIVPTRIESPDLVIMMFDHNKAEDRAPPDKGLVSLVFHDNWARRQSNRSDADIVGEAVAIASHWLPSLSSTVELSIVQRWQYNTLMSQPGIYRLLGETSPFSVPGERLHFAGDFTSLSSVNTAITSGRAAARNIIRSLT